MSTRKTFREAQSINVGQTIFFDNIAGKVIKRSVRFGRGRHRMSKATRSMTDEEYEQERRDAHEHDRVLLTYRNNYTGRLGQVVTPPDTQIYVRIKR